MRVLMLPAVAAILLIGADLLCAPAANAQVQSPSPGATVQPSNIPDQKLNAAAAAVQRVTSLKKDYQQRITAAAPADKERIVNSILEVAQNDPGVRAKIRQRMGAPTE